MINPSASGWIEKFFLRLKGKLPLGLTDYEFYRHVRETGFIYGHVSGFQNLDKKEIRGWTAEEVTKAALLNTLYELYRLVTKQEEPTAFIDKAIGFYAHMVPEGYSFLKRILPASPVSHELESIIDQRVKTNDNILSRNFSSILTNALLFMDILAFRQYLISGEIPEHYLKRLEETVVSLALLGLNSKPEKSQYDNLLIRLLETSVRYNKLTGINTETAEMLRKAHFEAELERLYLLDIAGMAIWSDGVLEQSEVDFLYKLAGQLELEDDSVSDSIADFDIFMKLHRKDIPYFKESNPVKNFYDHATQNVMLLINRNRNRLVKELGNNGELMLLLTHSTHRNLDKTEKKKVKKQLLEICKTIPSLTIFLLPGGSLLLPLLIKFIPQILPSVFNENLDRES